jgi:pilus assembly protein CpaE
VTDVLTPPPLAPSLATASGPQAVVYLHDKDSEGVVRQALSDLSISNVEYRTAGISTAMSDLAKRPAPRLLIVDATGLTDAPKVVSDLIALCIPSTTVLVIGETNDIRLYRDLRAVGVAEYFFKPLVTSLVARACAEGLGGQTAGEARGGVNARQGKLILVVGARGGVGATTIAVRTAWRLAERPPRPVAFLDMDLRFGDATLQMGVAPNHALREALARVDRVDDLFLERGLIQITERLALLAALEPLESPADFDEESLLALLDTLRRRYRYVVVDLPASHAVVLSRVLHLPSVLLLVSDGALSSAREVARFKDLLGASTRERTIMHVLNKSGAAGSLPLVEFVRGAGSAPDVTVPWSRQIALAVSRGVKAAPECAPLDNALGPVFARVAGQSVAATPRSLFGRLKR